MLAGLYGCLGAADEEVQPHDTSAADQTGTTNDEKGAPSEGDTRANDDGVAKPVTSAPAAPATTSTTGIPELPPITIDLDAGPSTDAAPPVFPTFPLSCSVDGKFLTRAIVNVSKCANGCIVNPDKSKDDFCAPATKCVAGGFYCGGDKVNGDPNTLFKCGADGFATTVSKRCASGCTVVSGSDDRCK